MSRRGASGPEDVHQPSARRVAFIADGSRQHEQRALTGQHDKREALPTKPKQQRAASQQRTHEDQRARQCSQTSLKRKGTSPR